MTPSARSRSWLTARGRDRYLRALDPDRLQDVVAALGNFEDRFEAGQVVPATIVLLNLFPGLPGPTPTWSVLLLHGIFGEKTEDGRYTRLSQEARRGADC